MPGAVPRKVWVQLLASNITGHYPGLTLILLTWNIG